MFPRAVAALFAALVCLSTGAARAQNRVAVYGAYFREPSTRVVEPMVMVTTTIPQGVDLAANYLLDAITSASVAQGTATDNIFAEKRQEAGLGGGYTFDRAQSPTRIGAAFRYSREPDYRSGTVGLQLSREVWGRSGFVQLAVSYSHDRVVTRMIDKPLDTLFVSTNYTQALSPTLLLQGGYETYWLSGYQANPYVNTPNLGRPRVPNGRLRHVFALRAAKYFPSLSGGVQVHHRFYFDQTVTACDWLDSSVGCSGPDRPDPWHMIGNTVEGRIYKTFARDFEVRFSYRFHHQTQADFWCNTNRSIGGNPDCYGPLARYHSSDEKYGSLTTHIPEIKLSWDLRMFADTPVLRFFAPGTADLAYARFFQETHYGDAHLVQAGYTLPF